MPNIPISNLIVFGDSMSDIGNKIDSGWGVLGRLLRKMRVNEVGRFSDGRNWTDYLWQWAGGPGLVTKNKQTTQEYTSAHLSLTAKASARFTSDSPDYTTYCNYAEGGAMGASDRNKLGLGTFKQQVERYLKEREKFPLNGHTMHIIWFGLNDLITNDRPPVDMDEVADEIGSLILKIYMKHKGETEHFMLMNLPDPAGAVRFIDKGDLMEVAALQKGVQNFNDALSELPGELFYERPLDITLVDTFKLFNDIADNMEKFGLTVGSQPHHVPVNYAPDDSDSSVRRFIATSDNAHPTEAVYKLIARSVADALLLKYDFRDLRNSSRA